MGSKLSQEEFLEKAKVVHGEKYDLSKVRYIGANKKIEVICPEHGTFNIVANDFVRGGGCKYCGIKSRTEKRSMTLESFLARAKIVHEGKPYDYSKTKIKNSKTKTIIICDIHGPWEVEPTSFLMGRGCPVCGSLRSKDSRRMTKETFIQRANKVHGVGRYIYDKVDYKNSDTKVEIICPEHGYWRTIPYTFLKGHGCPKCAAETIRGKLSLSQEEFEKRVKDTHGDKYDLSLSNYTNTATKTTIICREHGPWEARPSDLLLGHGCPKCFGSEKITQEMFEKRANALFGDKIDLSEAVYEYANKRVKVGCKIHDQKFEIHPSSMFRGNFGCPCCRAGKSKGEEGVYNYLCSLGQNLTILRNVRGVISPFELDIFIPEKNLAVEYNGVYYHNDQRKPRNYHRDKYLACKDKGVRLIQFTDIAWETRQDQIKSLLANALGVRTNEKKIDARKCEVRQVNVSELKDFYDTNHIQGHCRTGSLALALFSGSEIVAGIVFGKGTNRRGKARIGRNGEWTLSRYATNCVVRGGFQKLLKHGRGLIGWEHDIISFSMLDLFSGKTYKAAGFELDAEIGPDYQVYHPRNGLRPKSHWQRRMIPKRLQEIGWEGSFDPETDPRTEWQLEDEVGAVRVWDSGKIRWRLRGVDK